MTHRNDRDVMKFAEFSALLDAYGGERARWPAGRRAAMEKLASSDVAASRLLAEAQALDRVLAAAPVPAVTAQAALADRIVKAAAGKAVAVVETARTSAGGRSAQVIDLSARRKSASRPAPLGSVRIQKLAAALAASLMLGMFVGASDWSRSAIEPLAHAVGFGSDIEVSVAEMHEATDAALEEELL